MPPDDITAPPPPLRIGLPSRLGEMLIRRGLVTSDEVQAALAEQAAGSEWRLGRLLVQRGALDDRTLVQAIAHQFHVPVVDLRIDPPTPAARERLAGDAARRLRAVPLRVDADALVVAVADPPVRELRVAVERSTGLPVRLVLAAADDLRAALERWYSEDAAGAVATDAAVEDAAVEDAAVGDDVDDVGPPAAEWPPPAPAPEWEWAPPEPASEWAPPEPASEQPAPEPGGPPPDPDSSGSPEPEVADATDLQIVVWLLTEAVHRDASAIHLDHGEDGLRIRYRVDGAIVPGPLLPRTSGTVVCHRLLAAACLDPADDGLHEGAFDTVVDGRSITCRVTALTTASGTHVVVRTEATVRPARLEDLGIGRADAAAVRAILQEGRGVVAVASALPAAAAEVGRVLVDEAGPESHVVMGVMGDTGVALSGAVLVAPGDDTNAAEVVPTARALGADVLVVDVEDPEIRRGAFDAAAELLVLVRVEGQDPSDVAGALVRDVGAFLVAGMLRAVVVAGTDPAHPAADVHLVTEDVCRAILAMP